jgi:hypothetical protein
MAYDDQETVHKLYRKLLTLYPRTFKERLGESMEQTFNDLWNEKQQTNKRLFGPVLWIFVETAIGISKERLFLIFEGDIMQTIITNLRSSALISFLLILPFMIMEVVNRQSFRVSGKESFPFPLFGILWFQAILFVLSLMLILRNLRRAGNKPLVNAVFLLIGIAFLVSTAWAWGSWIIDQMPCFLGVPNCD